MDSAESRLPHLESISVSYFANGGHGDGRDECWIDSWDVLFWAIKVSAFFGPAFNVKLYFRLSLSTQLWSSVLVGKGTTMSSNHSERDPLIARTCTQASNGVESHRPGPLDISRTTRYGILAGIWSANFLAVCPALFCSYFPASYGYLFRSL